MDALAKKVLKRLREREKAPKPVSAPKSVTRPPPPPPPPPPVNNAKVEALVVESHQILAKSLDELVQQMAAMVNGRRSMSSVSIKINTRDSNGNIKSMTVTPEKDAPRAR